MKTSDSIYMIIFLHPQFLFFLFEKEFSWNMNRNNKHIHLMGHFTSMTRTYDFRQFFSCVLAYESKFLNDDFVCFFSAMAVRVGDSS